MYTHFTQTMNMIKRRACTFCLLLLPHLILAQYYGLEENSETWCVGLKVGHVFIQGDVAPVFPAYELGVYGQKSLGRALDIRLQVQGGQARGLDGEPTYAYWANNAWNGTNNPDATYDSLGQVYYNYQMTHYDLSLLFKLNLNRLGAYGGEGWDLYVLGGVGALMYQTRVDALNDRNQPYEFERISASDPKEAKASLRDLLDGTYETPAEQDFITSSSLGDYRVNTFFSLGAGLKFMLGDHIGLGAEGRFTFINDDLLDGQQWADNQTITADTDRLISASLLLDYTF